MATEAGTGSVAAAEVAAGSGAGRGLAPPPARIAPMSDEWRGVWISQFYAEADRWGLGRELLGLQG